MSAIEIILLKEWSLHLSQRFKHHSHREAVQMSSLWEFAVFAGSATEQVLGYLERHHWFFGFIVVGYLFHLHDKSLHARLDALDRRLDEIRKRLACDS
jgi:hypothetical protein